MYKPTIGELMSSVIKRTENPVAPLQVQALAAAIENLAPTMAGIVDEAKSAAVASKLMDKIPELEVQKSPELILALMGMLKESLQLFVRDSAGDPSLKVKAET